MKVIDNASCACGHSEEDTKHFLFECPNFANERQIFNNLDQRIPKTVETFLKGNNKLPGRLNSELYGKVGEYIINTGRFRREN